MGNQNPYENYPQNPDGPNNQPPRPGEVPPTEAVGPGYTPQSYPATKYDQPGAYLPPTQYDQPGAYPPPPPSYEQPPVYAPPPQYQQPGAYPPPPLQYQQPVGYAPQGARVPYGVPGAVPTTDRRAGYAIAGLVLGIISIVAAIFPICGFPVSIVGIIMSVLGRRSLTRRTLATVGLVLAIIGIVLTVLSFIYGFNYSLQHYQQ